MKAIKIFIFIITMILFGSVSFTQTNTHKFEVHPFKVNLSPKSFFIPKLQPTIISFDFSSSSWDQWRTYLPVISSPIHYTSLFCKMEVENANVLGIMIKVHAGDYDKYMSGCGYNK